MSIRKAKIALISFFTAVLLTPAAFGQLAADQRFTGVWQGQANDGYGTYWEASFDPSGRYSVTLQLPGYGLYHAGYWSIINGALRLDINDWRSYPQQTIPVAGEWWAYGFPAQGTLMMQPPDCTTAQCPSVTLYRVR